MKWIGAFDVSLADITSIVAGTGLSGGATSGAATLNVDVSQPTITTLAGVSAIGTAGTPITVTSDTVTFTSANADDPAVIIQNTTNDAQGARLKFNKNRGVDGVDSDNVGEIEFWSYDDGTPSAQQYGKILCQIHDATSGEESGLLKFGVANEDGDVGYGLILTGGSANNEIDVTVGLGASSIVTIPGDLSCSGGIAADVTGDLTGQADTVATIAGLAPNTATTQNVQPHIEEIGTDGDTLVVYSDTLSIGNTTTNMPLLKMINQTDDATGPRINLQNQRVDSGIQAGEDDDVLGKIGFWGYDDQPATQQYAQIYGDIHDATSGEESGRLTFQVANHDGGLGSGLILTGGSIDNEIDATIGLGAASTVTIPGDIDLAGKMVNRVSQIVNLKGYATLQNDVYDYANSFSSDDEAPFQLDESYGSGTINSSTEVNQGKLLRSGGFHVPFACTVSALQTQLACNNAGNVSIALVEYRPSKLAADQVDYPRTVYETVVNASDNNNNKVDTVTIAAGDLDNTAVPAGSHLMIMVKGDGTSVGGLAVISVAIGLSW